MNNNWQYQQQSWSSPPPKDQIKDQIKTRILEIKKTLTSVEALQKELVGLEKALAALEP